ncbi:hypothetical protein BGZ95_009127 [Linnemannia exigua]|uniref:Myb-like domain-containing protein n=1 Tax=Linnemannia exigua TaxID=604196 RepID=A0AAD4DDA4_9FUNG|nr:hypothetical protein BGZ95_009127 [Linnemannia exigua]
MSIVSSIPSGTMGSTSDRVTSVAVASALDVTSPPVTPPTKSSGPNAGSASQSSLPSPPPSSSSRHSRTVEQDEPDYDHDHNSNIYPSSDHNNSQSSIEQIARRLPSSTTSTHQQLPSTLNNKHISVAKTKTLGHLARSTSSEVDSEVANALASGRSIVSKTDWKEEDAQYLVQLIEAQFPKGNIIWDWVGHQMVDRGFTKSQCRSKWKRIRTKVLHGDGNPHTKDRDQALEHEVDELNEEEYEELPTDIPDLKWRHQQAEQEISTSQSYSARSNTSFDRPQLAFRTGPTAREEELAAVRRSQYSNRTVTQLTYPEQGGEHWSEDDERRQEIDSYLQPVKRFSDYPEQDRTPPSRSPQQHRRTSGSHHPSSAQGDDAGRSSTALSAIAATPTIFGKIEWKPEDSDYLVHLIETKFASRKVDWAYVSKQMEGRGYDRTQCKSRWWRVQHRQNQSQGGSVSSPASRGGRPRKNVDRRESQPEYDQLDDEKEKISDTEDILPQQTLETLHEYRSHQQLQQPDTATIRSPSVPPQQHPHPSDMGDSQPYYPQESNHRVRHEDEDSQGTVDELTRSPRATRGHEHQKHIEWKEEDSQYMFRMIEREFPVGNVVWSVIGERMASRGYSQTQCMSKWRRHLKNSKTSNDITGPRPSGISMDLDIDMEVDGSSAHNHHRENRLTGFRRPRKEDLLIYGDNRGSSSGGDHHSSGKRVQSDLVDSRTYDRDEFQSPTAQLDARLVEMEFDRYFNVGNKRRRTIEGESHGSGSYAGPEPTANGYYYRGVSSSYEDESAHHRRQPHHHHRRLSSEVHHEDYPRRSSYRMDEHASSGDYGERERSRRRSSHVPGDEGAVVVVGEEAAAVAVGPTGSAGPYERERDSHNGERQGRRYDEREWDTAMAVDNEREEPPSLSSKSQHREPHSSRSHYADENNGRYYYDEREPTRVTSDQNKAARHRPQEPARYNEPIGRSPDRGLVGTTHISSLPSSSSYPNVPSSGGHRDRELVSPRGDEGEEYDVIEQDERYYRDLQQHHRRRSQHQPQQHASRRPSSLGRDNGGRNGYYDDNYGKRRYRQSSAEHEHHRQDYGYRQPLSSPHSHGRSEREGDFIDYAMEDDLDWANGRWEGRDMARLAAAVARQGRRWDAIRAQIQIPVLASPYDDQEYADIYEGFRFEPLPTSTVDRHYSRQHHHHSSSSSHRHGQSHSYSHQALQQQQPMRHQRRPSYQQPMRQDRRKTSQKIHHRPSSSSVTVPAPSPVDGDYSQHQAPSPSMSSSKRSSGAIAFATSSSYAGAHNERMSPSVTGAKALAGEVVVIDQEYTEEEYVNRSRPQQDGEQDEMVDVDSVDQGQAPREEEEEVVMAEAAIMAENEKEAIVVEQEEETAILEIEPMEVDEERHREDLVVQSVSAENKASSEVDAEILQESTETVTTSMTLTTTTTTTVIAATSTTEQDVEALAMH